ncbi:MAG: hypothetical protein AAFQ43_00895 [Bacteroidota bacterium]
MGDTLHQVDVRVCPRGQPTPIVLFHFDVEATEDLGTIRQRAQTYALDYVPSYTRRQHQLIVEVRV